MFKFFRNLCTDFSDGFKDGFHKTAPTSPDQEYRIESVKEEDEETVSSWFKKKATVASVDGFELNYKQYETAEWLHMGCSGWPMNGKGCNCLSRYRHLVETLSELPVDYTDTLVAHAKKVRRDKIK